MNAATAIRPAPYSAVRFEAFRVSGNQTARLSIGECDSLEDATRAAALACLFKEQLLIRETDEAAGAVKLHLFTIRRKAPTWLHMPGEQLPRRVQQQFADPVCVIDGSVLGA